MMRKAKEEWLLRALPAGSVVLVVFAWEWGSTQRLWDPTFLPRPTFIIQTLAALLTTGDTLWPLLHTVWLFAVCYTLACTIGVICGLGMGLSPLLYGLLEPLVEILRSIPKASLIPALFLFFGVGYASEILVVVLGAFVPVLINTFQGVRTIDPTLIDVARTFRVPSHRFVPQVIIPAALPMIFAGMRIAMGMALALVILAEMLSGGLGVGFLILDSQRSFRILEMYAWVFVLAALGGGLAVAFNVAERKLVPWRGRN